MDIQTITKLTQEFAAAHAELNYLGQTIDAEIATMKVEHAARFRALSAKVRERHAKLSTAIGEAPELFEKPRTMVIAGVRVGLAKGKGGIEYGDPDDVVRRIEKQYGEESDQYLHVKKCPDKEALEKLPTGDLMKLGCAVVNAGDKPVIKPLDGEMTTLAKSLLSQLAKDDE